MQCPFCGQDRDKVIDSRSSDGGRMVRRRRQCLACHRRFTTYERVEDSIRLTVVKKDGSRVPYDRNKVLAGIRAACYKRPISEQELLGIVEAAEEEIYRQYAKEVPSAFIGDVVCRHLRALDAVAYVRFASVYREFQDVGEFIDEAKELKDTPAHYRNQPRLFEKTSGDN
ncbi:MAG: transcriptional repressor NrdR [Planctomycetes bacterium]|nr:transcriptional repressor NrdR [Planctomycetota bacterium]